MDSFLSLYTNVISPEPISREDILGYVVFCTVTCNGTSHVAEVVRFITELCAHDRDTGVFVKDMRCEWMHSKAGVQQFYTCPVATCTIFCLQSVVGIIRNHLEHAAI